MLFICGDTAERHPVETVQAIRPPREFVFDLDHELMNSRNGEQFAQLQLVIVSHREIYISFSV